MNLKTNYPISFIYDNETQNLTISIHHEEKNAYLAYIKLDHIAIISDGQVKHLKIDNALKRNYLLFPNQKTTIVENFHCSNKKDDLIVIILKIKGSKKVNYEKMSIHLKSIGDNLETPTKQYQFFDNTSSKIRIVSRIFVGKFAHPWANKRQKKATRYLAAAVLSR